MFIDVVPNGRSASAVLLRESYREGSKVRKRTLANLSKLPASVVDGLRVLLQGGTAIARPEEVFEIQRSLPHGHVAAVIGMLRKLDLPRLLSRTVSRERDLALALIASRIIAPGSKLATARALSPETAGSSLGRVLDLGVIEEREIYAALDWLGERQDRIERSLARRHLKNGALMLYDISSSYVEGRRCELARHGYSRDRRPDRLQIVYGLLCDRDGRPIAVEVFEGDVGDPSTLSAQISKLKQRFGLKHVVLVGDRGMITSARIREDLQPAGLDWITTLRAPQIQALSEAGPLQLSLFDERNLAEITRLSRRTTDRLPQSRARQGAGAQARRVAGRDRTRSLAHRCPCPPALRAAAGQGRDRPGSGRRDRPPQDGQTLRADHHRRQLRVPPQAREYRPRSASRRSLCGPNQRAGRDPQRR
jgi:hypothetical protein